MRIAVTGATGFIGGAVANAAEARGWEVVRYARRQGKGVVYWDLAGLPPARLPHVDAVVHAGAHVADWGDTAVFHRANVEGTRAVAEAFAGTRLVYISSSSVYPWWEPCVDRAEDEVAARHLNAYGRSKALADVEARRHGNAVALRPHAVYGPGDRTLLPRLVGNIRGGRLLSIGHAGVKHQLTHVDNLTRAILAACQSTVRGAVNVGDARPVELGAVLRQVLDVSGHSDVPVTYLPEPAAWRSRPFRRQPHGLPAVFRRLPATPSARWGSSGRTVWTGCAESWESSQFRPQSRMRKNGWSTGPDRSQPQPSRGEHGVRSAPH